MSPTKRKKPTKRMGRNKVDLPHADSSEKDSSQEDSFPPDLIDEADASFRVRTEERAMEGADGTLPDDGLFDKALPDDSFSDGALPDDDRPDSGIFDSFGDDSVGGASCAAMPVEADSGSNEGASVHRRCVKTGKKRRSRVAFALRVVLAIMVVAIIACFAVFAWDRWFRYDDAADLVGTWRAEGGENSFTITETEIELASDATLSYTIDPFSKTISYTLGYLEGSGRYRFSFDRTQLAIVDGGSDSWLMTMSDDMAYAIQYLWAALIGSSTPELAIGDNAIVLTKESSSSADASESASEETALDESEG